MTHIFSSWKPIRQLNPATLRGINFKRSTLSQIRRSKLTQVIFEWIVLLVATFLPRIHITWTCLVISQLAFTCSKLTMETRCEICSKLTIKTPERRHWCCCGALIVNVDHFSHLVLLFLLLTLNMLMLAALDL